MNPFSRQVYVVDDDPAVLRALGRALTGAGFQVATFGSAREFLARPPHHGPACLLVDQKMPDVTGLELQDTLLGQDATLAVIFVTAFSDVQASVRAMKAGAVDFLTKPVDLEELLEAVKRALERSESSLRQLAERAAVAGRFAQLTPRQRQVCHLISDGLLNKQIAAELGVSIKTVKIHRARLLRKLNVKSVVEMTRLVERARTLGAAAAVAPDPEPR